MLAGDPSKEGGYVVRLKLPSGYKVAPHTHPNDENVTVISGMFHVGIGDKFDESKGQAVKPGGYGQVPKGVKHFAWASQDTVIQLHGVGLPAASRSRSRSRSRATMCGGAVSGEPALNGGCGSYSIPS